MFRIAICDDDLNVCNWTHDRIREFEKSIDEKISISVYSDGIELLNRLTLGDKFDLIILDIQMKHLDGVTLGNKLRDEFQDFYTDILYISSEKDYAMELFHSRPINFLLKPLKIQTFISAVEKSIKHKTISNKIFEFKVGTAIHRVPIKDILYFESKGRKVSMTTRKGKYEFYQKLNDIEDTLNNDEFIRIHKSYLVNYQHVSELKYDSVTMVNNYTLAISQNYRSTVRNEQLRRGGQE